MCGKLKLTVLKARRAITRDENLAGGFGKLHDITGWKELGFDPIQLVWMVNETES